VPSPFFCAGFLLEEAEDRLVGAVRLDGEGFAGIAEQGVARGEGAGSGLVGGVQLMGGEFVVEEAAAEGFEELLEVHLGAVVGFAGLGEDSGQARRGAVEERADRRARDFDRVGRVEILDPDRVVGVGAGKEAEAVEALGGEGLEEIGCGGELQAGEGLVLGLKESQRVAQDCLAVLGSPNRQGGFARAGPILVGVVDRAVERGVRRSVPVAPVVRVSLLHAECGTRGRSVAVDS
jgi:hypothetical protein